MDAKTGDLFPWMPDFYCDDMYWLVTEDGVARGLFSLEDDARQLFASIDPVAIDGDVHLWRLNGGHLCRPHADANTLPPLVEGVARLEELQRKRQS